MAELIIGTKVKDRYTLKEFKGSGSFGEVWLAHDEVLDCDVAIKIYISLDPRGVEEFKSEYITTQGISHPNLLTTTYFDVWEQRPFLVMKYCAKGSSSALAGKMDEYALWQFIHDVAAGLKYLHNMPEPIIHQDIKPDNILVDDSDRYLITDFGISKKIRSTMRKQSKRAVGAGATAYMGPERFESNPTPVKASDIWSLGASIYELATGELPFSGLGGGMQRNGAELPILGNKWSKDMTMVMQSCLAKETWDRPTAQQLEEYSDAILKGLSAKITWISPISQIEETPVDSVESDKSSIYENDGTSDKHSNKIWMIVIGIMSALVCLFLILSSKQSEDTIIIPEDTVETIDSITPDSISQKDIDIPEVESKRTETKQAMPSVPTQPKRDKAKVKTENEQLDDSALRLKKAIAEGDTKTIEQLANQEGYIPAFIPFAKVCLERKNYEDAEIFASAAKANGNAKDRTEADKILKLLSDLGYFD